MELNKIKEEATEYTETDPLRDGEPEKVERNVTKTCVYVFENITVEPVLLCFISAAVLNLMTTQNLNLEKACRVNLNHSDEVCTAMKAQSVNSQNAYEKEAQVLIASALAAKTYISATVPSLLALFIGSWSDRTGHRKIFLMMPVVGQLLLSCYSMMNVYFFMELPLEVLVFGEAVLEGFSGAWCIMILTVFSYITAITSGESRTVRMGLISFSMSVGFPIGMGLSGVLLKNFGYYGGYGLAGTVHALNLSYIIFLLKETPRSKDQRLHDGQGFCYFLKTFFNPSHIKDTFVVVFRKAEKNRRKILCVLLATVSLLFGPMYGEISILYLSTRYRFNWDEVQFSIFQTYSFITHTLGTIFSILVFSKKLQWNDSVLGIISTISKIASSFVFCFAPNPKIFYIAPIVDILNGTSMLAMRAIFSKSVKPDEIGKVNSVVSLTENLMPLAYVPIYTTVYTSTMEVLPGAVFLLSSGLTLPALFVFIWLFYRHRKSLRQTKDQNGPE